MKVKDVTNMYQDLLKIAKYHGVDYEDAQDIVQDLFVKLTEIEKKEGNLNRLTYKGKINTVYLFNAVRNITLNKIRSKKNNIRIIDDYDEMISRERSDGVLYSGKNRNIPSAIKDDFLTDDTNPEYDVKKAEIKEHLKTLDPFCQKLYTAYMQDNISMRELSRKTNISVTTIFYGVKNIRETLKEIFYESN